MDVEIIEINPQYLTPEEWKEFHEFRKIRHQEISPEDELEPDETYEASMKFVDPETHIHRFFIKLGEKLVGYMLFAFPKEGTPSYEQNKELLQLNLYILQDYRRNGFGMVALQRAVKEVKTYGKSMFLVQSDQKSAREFLEKLGVEIGLHGGENRMDLNKLDWKLMDTWINDGQEQSPASSIFQVTRIPDEDIEEYCRVYTETLNQQPLDEIEMGQIIVTRETMRTQEEHIKQIKGTLLTTYTKTDGQISGLSELRCSEGNPKLLHQGLTGVVDKFRGQGLGKWIKAANIKKAKELFPSAEKVSTGNADTNAAMLSINQRMGFYKHKETFLSQFTIDLLEHAVDSYFETHMPVLGPV